MFHLCPGYFSFFFFAFENQKSTGSFQVNQRHTYMCHKKK